ncbi:hypothetical protein VPH35_121121 [Triticum aestivum]|uniref:Uncharacterized protein n=2 Tax=Triticum TaxID=4564 RepID=A0A9R0Z3D8_TRITD|nr:unnamed protein product [Triticum turgidum subsp. durum]
MSMARVLRTSVVAPSPSPGGAALPERSLPLNHMDAMWLHTSPVERVFLFHRADQHDDAMDVLLSNLQDSLSEALRSFYPLAGRLRITPDTPNRHELHYQPGDGVSFTVAEYDHVGVDKLATDEPTELARIAPLMPRLPEGGAVLALQVTLLRRGGLAVGVTVHHAACDGACSTHFLHTWAWAAASRGATIAPELPVIGRTFIRDRDDLYDAFAAPRPYRDRVGKLLRSPDAVVDKLLATFVLSEDLLRRIKDTVAREAARRGVSPLPPPPTSTVATYGFIWHCYYRSKESSAGGGNDDRAYAVFAADHRARLDPPVPATYLGNCLGLCFATAGKKEITAAGAGGLLAACSAVAAAIDEATRPRGGDGGRGSWDACLERVVEAYGAGVPLTLAGSPRFRVYDVDFGFGRPAKVDIVSVARTGAMSVAEGRGGAGGTEVGISLPPDGMHRFRRCFADAVACLSSTSPVKLAGADTPT